MITWLSLSDSVTPDVTVSEDVPMLHEVTRTIRRLKNGRAAGADGWDGITAELLKGAEKPISEALHKVITHVWSTGRVSAEWKEGIIFSLYKGKGSQSECSSYRPISLLSVSGKVFAYILLARIQPLLDKCCRPQQSGFTAGRSTMDAILALTTTTTIFICHDNIKTRTECKMLAGCQKSISLSSWRPMIMSII